MDATEPNLTGPDEPRSPFGLPPCPESAGPRWSGAAKAALLFTGVVLPLICFAISFPDRPAWQSGALADYAKLLLAHKPSAPLYPFLLYAMTCMTLLVFAPARFVRSFVVRLGVYTGVLLALQYWLIFVIVMDEAEGEWLLFVVPFAALLSFAAVVVPWIVGWLIVTLFRRIWRAGLQALLLLMLLAIVGVVGLLASRAEDPAAVLLGVPIAVGLFCLLCSTPWAVASYAAMAICAARNSEVRRLRFSLGRLMGIVTWLAAFLGAWRTSVLLMLQEYAKLPTTAPGDCYVSTAAARGHRRLVGAEEYAAPRGQVRRVNDQMRYLKAAELLLAGVSPTAHRLCRRVYDRIGPRLAATLIHPLLADVAYLSLKPAEWLARAALALLLPGQGPSIRALYRADRDRLSTCSPDS